VELQKFLLLLKNKDEEIEKLKLRVSQLENCEKLSQDLLLENQKLEL